MRYLSDYLDWYLGVMLVFAAFVIAVIARVTIRNDRTNIHYKEDWTIHVDTIKIQGKEHEMVWFYGSADGVSIIHSPECRCLKESELVDSVQDTKSSPARFETYQLIRSAQ